MTEAQDDWAASFVGQLMKHQMGSAGYGTVVGYQEGKKKHGVYFLTDNNLRIYRRYPVHLREGFQSTP